MIHEVTNLIALIALLAFWLAFVWLITRNDD